MRYSASKYVAMCFFYVFIAEKKMFFENVMENCWAKGCRQKQIPPTAASNIHTQKNSINTPAPKPNCFLYNKIQTEY